MTDMISILGSTGSIGSQTVSAAERLGIRVAALTANRDVKKLEQQARRLRPAFVAMYDESAAGQLKTALADTGIAVGSGMDGLVEAASMQDVKTVVTAVSGSVGLLPTIAAIDCGKRIALANKETLVCAGELVMARAAEKRAQIIPVDSEHSAIFQCIAAGDRRELKKILLTGSGGPFRGMTKEQTKNVTPDQAIRHPNWSMGVKISVDSATMMNKGLEFIEAMRLFAVSPNEIEIIIHPESIIHSMVEFDDGAVIAQLGMPDMTLPIQYALTYPERLPTDTAPLDLTSLGSLTFMKPHTENLPCLALAFRAACEGGTATAVLNAANEAAVGMFLQRRIGFNQISECVESALDSIDIINSPSLDDIMRADKEARAAVTAAV